jgi:hypothetical protein
MQEFCMTTDLQLQALRQGGVKTAQGWTARLKDGIKITGPPRIKYASGM